MDAILRFLIAEIALSGKTGSSTSDFRHYLEAYHQSDAEGRATAEAHRISITEGNHFDEFTCAQIWSWLTQHPEISIGVAYNQRSSVRELKDVETFNRNILSTCRANHINDQATSSDRADELIHCACPPNSSILKLFASEEQIWHAATGHGVDHERIPSKDFDCLSVIAAHREKGVLQPRVARMTGQDIKSVPQRNQRLCDAGYIVKMRTIVAGTRTSLLMLTRFAADGEKAVPNTQLDDNQGQPHTPQLIGLHAKLSYGRYSEIVDLIHEALRILENEKIVVWDDLKRRLGLRGIASKSRLFAESIRILENAGAVQRVKARSNIPELGSRLFRSVQFVKAIPEEDVRARLGANRSHLSMEETGGALHTDAHTQDGREPSEVGDASVNERLRRCLNTRWSPHRQLIHQLRELVDEEGNDGITLPDLRDALVGPTFQRPLENQLSRAIESWQLAQPLHLWHLGVIRDTLQVGKLTMFVYYANHRLEFLLRSGQISVQSGLKLVFRNANPPRDAFGFLAIDPSTFLTPPNATSWINLLSKGPASKATSKGRGALKDGALNGLSASPRPRGRPRKYPRKEDDQFPRQTTQESNNIPLPATDTPGSDMALNQTEDDTALQRNRKRRAEGLLTPTEHYKRSRLVSPNATQSDPFLEHLNESAHSLRARVAPNPPKTIQPARDSKLYLMTYSEQDSTLKREGTGLYVGELCELNLPRRGRGPKSRLAVINTPLLRTLEFFVPEEATEHIVHGNSRTAERAEPSTSADETSPVQIKPPRAQVENQEKSLEDSMAVSLEVDKQRPHPVETALYPQTPQRSKPNANEGSVAARRKQTILDIVKQADGAYPGDTEIWFPFATIWMQKFSIKPDTRTVRTTVKALVDSGKLETYTFSFETKVGNLSKKRILHLPGTGPDSERVRQLQEKMISNDPKLYFPTGPAIDPVVNSNNSADEPPESPARTRKPTHIVANDTVKLWRLPEHARKLLARLSDNPQPRSRVKRHQQGPEQTEAQNTSLQSKPMRPVRKKRATAKVSDSLNEVDEFTSAPGLADSLNEAASIPQISSTIAPSDKRSSPPPIGSARGLSFDHAVRMIEESELKYKKYHLPRQERAHFRRDGEFLNLFSKASQLNNFNFHAQTPPQQTLALSSSNAGTPEVRNEVQRSFVASNKIQQNGSSGPSLARERLLRPLEALQYRMRTFNPLEPQAPALENRNSMADRPGRLATLMTRPGARLPGPQRSRLDLDFGRKLFVATILTKIVTGGLDQQLDWEIVTAMLGSGHPPRVLRKRWNNSRHSFRHVNSYIQDQIREVFLRGYEEGTIPSVNFEDRTQNDWAAVYNYIIGHLDSSSFRDGILHLQSSVGCRSKVEQLPAQDMSDFYGASITFPKRALMLHSAAFVRSPEVRSDGEKPYELVQVARNWVRANVAADNSSYDRNEADAKLRLLGNDAVQKALEQLLAEKVISQRNKGRPSPGKGYDFSEVYTASLSSPIDIGQYREAVSFKHELDATFETKAQFTLGENAPDGVMLVVLNLVAHHQIDMLQDAVPSSHKGLIDVGYKTREIDEKQLVFNVELTASDAYVPGNPLSPLPPAPKGRVSRDIEGTEWTIYPLWYDINGNLVRNLWTIVRTTIISQVALRSGINAEQLQKAMNSALEDFEIRLVLAWMVEAGAAEWLDAVGGSVRLLTWWWMAMEDDSNGGAL